ncbi:MAG: symmetrical bis(5'-nucleosyl)-tetraphosphatase [Methylococcaceae bacterium]|jgi:bis(5'-nucleosyl)-tetraphosphatase (symmetrical)|nr:symmetrical bis(5'-nucleosyl)-tetraphosphatase [Methylococcaceae bacterium]
MAIYAIGDVQGCHAELLALLEKIAFDPRTDQVWFVGDLVNRGPRSLETLRTIRDLGESAICVLGNHDLHLLAVAAGISRTKHRDTFGDVLSAPDRDELLQWLRHRPLLHENRGFYLIHAGLPPQWTAEQAVALAHEAEAAIRGDEYAEFLAQMYGNQPDLWDVGLMGPERLRFITNCLTRLRYCTRNGRVDFKQKGRPGTQPAELLPWFAVSGRRSAGMNIVFGHWSTLGFHVSEGAYCLDTGCLWGGELTALRLDGDFERIAVPNMGGRYQIPSPA